jgi:putative endonuclease
MAFLESQGWTVVAHRFRAARHEVDIVARRGKLVAFVEVKRRSGDGFGSPFEALRGRQRRDLVRAARAWMDRYGAPGDVYRFDVIGIVGERLEYLEDAFRPGWR